jgi:predicted RNA methylase
MDKVFCPITSGIPSYFTFMLKDVDRNLKYEDAIKKQIQHFIEEQGFKPRVLDLGAGTGLLSSLALKHGAAHVTAVEVNRDLCAICKNNVPTAKVICSNSLKIQGTFDMVISELLGTMLNSESQYIYIWDLLNRGVIKNFGTKSEPKFYTVPQQATATVTSYKVSNHIDKTQWQETIPFGIYLHRISEPIVVLTEKYDKLYDGIFYSSVIEMLSTKTNDIVDVLEWECQLYDDIILTNKIETNFRIRYHNWGNLYRFPHVDGYHTVKYRPNGIDIKPYKGKSILPITITVSDKKLREWTSICIANLFKHSVIHV